MPNWCDNVATFTGSKEQIEKLKNANGQILNVLVPTPHSEWNYDWSVANWGTKWEVDAEIVGQGEDWITVTFSSAWSPPIEAYNAAQEDGITVNAMYYESGMNFCGQYIDGEDQYFEIPNTGDEVREQIPEDIDEYFGISDDRDQWAEDNPEDEDEEEDEEEEDKDE
jgi:hypothetical protein